MDVSQSFFTVLEKCRQSSKLGDETGKEEAIIALTEMASQMLPDELEEILMQKR